MAFPHEVQAYGWIPFVVIVVLAFFFAWFYVRYYQDHSQSEVSSTLTAIIALTISLLTAILVPVDIFLVSYSKESNGSFKPWAERLETRQSMQTDITYVYYSLYALVVFFIFFLIPFVYFYFEEQDDGVTVKQRICSALKYTVAFIVIMIVLMLIGAFIPLKSPPKNTTDWDQRLSYLKDELEETRGETALTFLIGFLSFIGMLAMITYTAYGMVAMPMAMIKGFRNVKGDRMGILSRQETSQERARMIRAKYADGRPMSSKDRQTLRRIEEEEKLLSRQERHLRASELNCLSKCVRCCRPFQILFGVLYLLFALLIFVSLLLTSLDKALHSLGYKTGYVLPSPQLPNPINVFMVYAQEVFPLDYCIFVAVVLYVIYCSMAGMKRMGIWFFCIKLYKIRPRKTMPQGLLFMCMILMKIVLTLNILLFTLAPQYVMYGSQHYQLNVTRPNDTHPTLQTKVCSTDVDRDDCTMTSIAMLLNRFFYKIWFFGACFFWGNWLLMLVFVLSLIVVLLRRRRSVVEEEMDSSDDDLSQDEPLINP